MFLSSKFFLFANSNIGQQCCYDDKGEFTRIKRQAENSTAAPAGSADYFFSTQSYLRHQYADYFPYRACCIETDSTDFCEDYYNIRPTDNNGTCTSAADDRGMYVTFCIAKENKYYT